MTTTFETARIGDKVWSIELHLWGEIQRVDAEETYPIKVVFPNRQSQSYTFGGKRVLTEKRQILFWDEVKINAPQKPLPDLEIDAKVWTTHWVNWRLAE